MNFFNKIKLKKSHKKAKKLSKKIKQNSKRRYKTSGALATK